jgi:hypothetical protein
MVVSARLRPVILERGEGPHKPRQADLMRLFAALTMEVV